MNDTLTQLQQVGAAQGFTVLGASLMDVRGVVTPAPSSDTPDFCFIQSSCIYTAVAAGIVLLLVVILCACCCSKMCGSDKNATKKPDDYKQREIDRQQHEYELDQRSNNNSNSGLQRGNSYRQQQPQPQGILVPPEPMNAAPRPNQGTPSKYSSNQDAVDEL